VSRIVVAEGSHAVVECAVRADGATSPAADFLAQLGSGRWHDPQSEVEPDMRQVSLRDRLLALVEHLANGYDPPRNMFNYLDDGMWELKVTNARLTFYDTDGRGDSVTRQAEFADDWRGEPQARLPEDFGGIIRLGHSFAKVGQKTLRTDIDQAMRLREEDLAHDRD
jgi:hypothetical protein